MVKAKTNAKKKVTKAFARNGIKSMTEMLIAVIGANKAVDLRQMAENIKECYKAEIDPKLQAPEEIIHAVCTAKGAARGRRYLTRVCHPDRIKTDQQVVKDAAADLYNAIMCKTQKSLFNVSVAFVCRVKRNRLAVIKEMDTVVDRTIDAAIANCEVSETASVASFDMDECLRDIKPMTEAENKRLSKAEKNFIRDIAESMGEGVSDAMNEHAMKATAHSFMLESEKFQLMCIEEEGFDFDSPEVDPFAPDLFNDNFEMAANSCDGSMPGSVAVPADLLKQPVDLMQFGETACEFFNIPNDVPGCAPEEKRRFSKCRLPAYLRSLFLVLQAFKPKCIAELLMINSAAIRSHPALYEKEANGNRIVTSPWSGYTQFFVRMLTPEIATQLIRKAYISKTVNANGRHLTISDVGRKAGKRRGPLSEEQRAERKRKMQKKRADKILDQINGGIVGSIEDGSSKDEVQASVATPAKSEVTKHKRNCPDAPKKKARTAPGFTGDKRGREGIVADGRPTKAPKLDDNVVFIV